VGKLTFDYDNFDLEHEIVPGLWMGGTHDEDVVSKPSKLPVMSARKEFDAVVTLDSYARPFGWFVRSFVSGLQMVHYRKIMHKKLNELQTGLSSNGKLAAKL